MGSCSGGFLSREPCNNHSSNAVSCSLKNGDGWKSAPGSDRSVGSCIRHISAAMSHASHIGWLCVGGSLGYDTGVHPDAVMMRSASRKFRKRLATRRSERKSFWKSARGSMFHAIVSVMAVKIQLSSPSGVLRSVWRPGMRSISSLVMPSWRSSEREQNQRKATLIGVVRHAVKTSAGSSAFCGSTSPAPHAPSTITSLSGSASGGAPLPPLAPAPGIMRISCCRWSMYARNALTMSPAAEQSIT
mmetsp:Transcript_14024/g.40700  ORF Transcript_14024/g.40700 Transcript_14024/m.40700 type:complete len:245 (-) Transcript_14024:1172-1906(-)